MDRVSRPLLGLLVATVLVFVLWLVALKPNNSSTSANGNLGQYQGAINSAHNVQNVVNHGDAAAAGGTTPAATPTPASTPTTSAAPAGKSAAATSSSVGAPSPTTAAASAKPAAATAKTTAATAASTATAAAQPATVATHAPATAATRQQAVVTALRAGKVLALVFYNPGAVDDRAIQSELRSIPSAHGRVLSLAIPIAELSNYAAVTNQVPVTVSPTLLFIDRGHYATTLVGYASRFEIAQRVADALAGK